jgi:hypothetical protein
VGFFQQVMIEIQAKVTSVMLAAGQLSRQLSVAATQFQNIGVARYGIWICPEALLEDPEHAWLQSLAGG